MFDSVSPQSQPTPPQQPAPTSGRQQPVTQEVSPNSGSGAVYTMPQKFMPKEPAKKPASGRKTGLWIIIGLLVLLLIGVAIIAVVVLQTNATQEAANTNAVVDTTNTTPVTNTPTGLNATNTNAATNAVVNTPTNNANTLNINTSTNSSLNLNTNTSAVIDPATISPTRANAVDAADTDKDGLTDEEEELYTTKPNLPDTDSDGFIDGNEIAGFYSPLKADTRLGKTNLVTKYTDEEYGWSIFYPSNWLAEPLSSTNTEVLFTSDSVDGEFVEVLVADNTRQETAAEWYADLFDTFDAEDLETVTVSGLEGIISPDGYTYYLADDDYIFALNYNFGTRTEIHFRTTFAMMVDTFNYTSKASSAANTNTTNTNQ